MSDTTQTQHLNMADLTITEAWKPEIQNTTRAQVAAKAAAETEVSRLQAELQHLRMTLSGRNQDYEDLRGELDSLRHVRAEYEYMESQWKGQTEENKVLEGSVEALRESVNAGIARESELRERIAKLDEQLHEVSIAEAAQCAKHEAEIERKMREMYDVYHKREINLRNKSFAQTALQCSHIAVLEKQVEECKNQRTEAEDLCDETMERAERAEKKLREVKDHFHDAVEKNAAKEAQQSVRIAQCEEELHAKNYVIALLEKWSILEKSGGEQSDEWHAEVLQLAKQLGDGDVCVAVIDNIRSALHERGQEVVELKQQFGEFRRARDRAEELEIQEDLALQHELHQLEAKVFEQSGTIMSQEQQLREAQHSLYDLTSDTDQRQAEQGKRIAELEQELDGKKSIIAEPKKWWYEDYAAHIAFFEKELADKESLLLEMTEGFGALVGKESEEIAELKKQLGEAEQACIKAERLLEEGVRANVRSLEMQGYDLRKFIVSQEKQLEENDGLLAEKSDRIASLERQLSNTEKTLVASRQASEVLEAQHKAAIGATQQQLHDTEKTLHEYFRLRLKIVLEDVDELDEVNKRLEQRIAELEQQKRAMYESKQTSIRAVQQNADMTIQENRQTMARLHDELASTRTAKQEAMTTIKELEETLEAYVVEDEEFLDLIEDLVGKQLKACFGKDCRDAKCFCRRVVPAEGQCENARCTCQLHEESGGAEAATEAKETNVGDGDIREEVGEEEYEIVGEAHADSESDNEWEIDLAV